MTRLIRWLLALALGAGVVVSAPAAGAAGAAVGPASRGERLGGVQLRYLPRGLGTSTDFEYEYEDVSFVSRVWESGSDAAGWSVDLDVDVMRGRRLVNGRALHDWFIPYEDRPADEVSYHRIRIHGRPGWLTRDEVFWLVRPGLAIAMSVDRTRFSTRQLLRTARAARAGGCRQAGSSGRSSGPLADARTRSISQNARRDTILPSAFTR